MNDTTPNHFRIAAIGGSVRPGSFTAKALTLAVDEIRTAHPSITVDLFDPAGTDLPLPGTDADSPGVDALKEAVSQATGVILATPEYHGSYSSVMKLVIDNLGFPSVMSGKPVSLLGVAAGQIGAVKALEHLRSVCSHIGAIVLPGPVSVAGVQKVFDDAGRCLDPSVEKRIRGVATNLIHYIHNHICPRIALEQIVRS